MLAETVASAIVAGMAGIAQSKKAADGITKYAQKIRFRPQVQAELPSTEELTRLFGA